MKIAHIALWTQDLEQQARFWVNFFGGEINDKYCSKTNHGFESYFVTIKNMMVIELMTKPGLTRVMPDNNMTGWAHLAISLGSKQAVDTMATRAEAQGILVSQPRTTGDGYYEAVIRDPDGNIIEIVE